MNHWITFLQIYINFFFKFGRFFLLTYKSFSGASLIRLADFPSSKVKLDCCIHVSIYFVPVYRFGIKVNKFPQHITKRKVNKKSVDTITLILLVFHGPVKPSPIFFSCVISSVQLLSPSFFQFWFPRKCLSFHVIFNIWILMLIWDDDKKMQNRKKKHILLLYNLKMH